MWDFKTSSYVMMSTVQLLPVLTETIRKILEIRENHNENLFQAFVKSETEITWWHKLLKKTPKVPTKEDFEKYVRSLGFMQRLELEYPCEHGKTRLQVARHLLKACLHSADQIVLVSTEDLKWIEIGEK